MADIICFKDIRIIDGAGGVIEQGTLLLEEGRVRVPDASEPIPDGADVRSGAGRTALPGLIDCHVHLCMAAEPNPARTIGSLSLPALTLRAARQARDTLRAGVTTVRDCGSAPGVDAALKTGLREGWIRGPRVVSAGMALCITGGHGSWLGREADGPEEMRKAAREQLGSGAEWVKLIATGGVLTAGIRPGSPQLSSAEMQAAVEEAINAGRRAAAHAHGLLGIHNAVMAGVHSVEHGTFLDEGAMEMMKERGTFLVPTLLAPLRIVEHGAAEGIPLEMVRDAQALQEVHEQAVRAAREAGVLIAMGTDAGTPFNPHGENARELELMVSRAGFSPMEAIVASTSAAARLLAIDEEVGTLADGLSADVLVVEGNPLEEVGLLARPERIAHVFQAGVEV